MTAKLPSRLHHTAYVTTDLEATRHFYEDIIGLPLVATWCETDFLFAPGRHQREAENVFVEVARRLEVFRDISRVVQAARQLGSHREFSLGPTLGGRIVA